MDLRWHTQLELTDELRESVEQKIHDLAQEKDDLIHVVIDVGRNHNRNHGGAEAKIRCQARGVELIAHEHGEEPAVALQKALDAFVRKVRDRRSKQVDGWHQRKRR